MITDILKQILSARYGRDVRQAIHDGIQQCYYDGKAGAIDLEARQDVEALKESTTATNQAVQTLESNVADLQSAQDITTTDSTTQPNSHSGREMVLEIGGAESEQDSTAGNQLFDASNGKNGYYNTSGVFTADATWFACKVNAPSSKVITVSGAKTTNGSVAYAEFDSSNNYLGYSQTFKNCTVTLKDNTSYVYISCPASEKESLMVNAGTTALPYEPFTGNTPAPNPSYPMEIKKSVVKGIRTTWKNKLINLQESKTVNGVTFTVNKDKSVTVSGTATALTDYHLNSKLPVIMGEKYTLSGCSGGGLNTYYLRMSDVLYGSVNSMNEEVQFSPQNDVADIFIRIFNGTTINTTIYPMVRYADVTDSTYEPYTESSYTFSQPIELYGKDGVQDVIMPKEIGRKYGVKVFDGTETVSVGEGPNNTGGYYCFIRVDDNSNIKKPINAQFKIGAFCTRLTEKSADTIWNANADGFGIDPDDGKNIRCRFASVPEITSNETLQAKLAEWYAEGNPMILVYPLAESTTEALPVADQIGLNSLATYDGITYIEFICDELEPTFKGKYGTSEVGGYTLEALLTARNNALK